MEPGGVGHGRWTGGGRSTRSIVTPEAVALDLPTASLASRGLAELIDLAASIGGALAVLGICAAAGVGGTVIEVLSAFLVVAVVFGYPATMESLWRGRTLGKAALGLRVVTSDGGRIRPRHAVIRAVLHPVDLLAGVEAMLLSSRDRRLGDLLAGTLVVRQGAVAPSGPPFWFSPPPGWEAWAATLDTTGLGPTDRAVIRSFLLRWPTFDPRSRLDLAGTLAGPLASRLGHQPPPWLPPDAYLLCVIAARQWRDAASPGPVVSAAGPPPPSGPVPLRPPAWAGGWGPPAIGQDRPGPPAPRPPAPRPPAPRPPAPPGLVPPA